MRIESALYASSAGLAAQGSAISVISDNISNSNTTGFKAARVEFADLYAYGLGSKDIEVFTTGSGAKTASVRPIQVSGELEATGRALDVAVSGEGYFMVGDASAPLYTRAGNFSLDKNGYLITSDGQFVLGAPPTTTEGETASTTPTKINLAEVSSAATPTSAITLGGNLSSESPITTAPTGTPATFAEINATASTSQTIKIYDSQGGAHDVRLYFFKTAANVWTATAYMDASETGGEAGTPVQLATGSVTFENDGSISAANQANAVLTATSGAFANGAAAANFTINLASYTQTASPSELRSQVQDGIPSGSVKAYSIGKDGVIAATLTNGQTIVVGTLQLTKFTNMDGLVRQGNNYFKATDAAGTATTGAPGSSGLGELAGGALERSTTDIANQFIDLVLYQRGYQANSQMLNATAQMLRDTISMMR